MKLLSEEQRKELNSILGDGHTIYTTDKVKRICESIDVPFPDDIVDSYWTRYWQCSKHGLNVGKIHHLDKNWTREELKGKWAGGYLLLHRSSGGDGMDIVESIAIVRCCKKGQYLDKYKLEMWAEDGSIDLYKRYNCISGIDFNSWLGSYLKPKVENQWKTPPEGRGYRSRWYSEGVRELLEDRGYLEKTVSS